MENNTDINPIISRLEAAIEKIESSAVRQSQDEQNCYRRELENAIAVLRETKGSFHSKQLKDLRERIENVLYGYK